MPGSGVVGVLAVGAALMGQTAAGALRRLAPYLTRLSGALLVIAGAYVGWYGWYELRVYSGAPADDPIIAAASEVQNRLALWVDEIGPVVFAAVLAVFVVVAVILARVSSARRRSRVMSPTGPGRSE